MSIWDFYRCECGRRFALEQLDGDEIEEPACPECGGTYSQHERQAAPPVMDYGGDEWIEAWLNETTYPVIGD